MPKVRTGCLTCKQRRIKCDEAKPDCGNCSRTGRHCEYPVTLRAPEAASQEVVQAPRRLPIRVYNLPFKVPGSQADRQLLHFYCVEAAGSLSSFSDPTLWTSLILQRSHHQPVIRHALVTLAALHRAYLQGGNSIQPAATEASIQRIAKCHRQLRLYLRSPNATPDTPLICSILFYAFETLIGDANSAMQHLNNGLKLFKQCQANWHNDELLPHLMNIFSRLDVQASTFDDARIPILALVTPEEMSGVVDAVPDELLDLPHAEAVLTKLQNWLMHHIIAHVSHKHKPFEEFPPYPLHERIVLYHQYERFLCALPTLLDSLSADLTHRALLLRIQARMYHAILLENLPYQARPCSLSESSLNPPTPSQVPTDSLQGTLADIQAFLALDSPDSGPQNFTLCTQLVAILYFLCLKTSDTQSRLTALSLLQHSQLAAKDGLWEADKAVSIIQFMMQHPQMRETEIQTLEHAGSGIFDPEVGGIEQVFRRLSTQSVEPTDSGP
ncbi:hypothetical protein BDW59DRAFT_169709 [Aspergillus cavernicola]|uniref:Zn(2)-C6 fungal-type domain-containing protein n=1 Tax=Aspergillus cavernicola TaxID=176166 RepID=A0ABR4IUK1_9EURO